MKQPEGLQECGLTLWNDITEAYELAPQELLLLEQACRTADLTTTLMRTVEDEGELILSNRYQEPRVHPALVELRNQRILLARILVVLRIPLGETEEDGERTQRRPIRGWTMPQAS
jgi:hypothetical protein